MILRKLALLSIMLLGIGIVAGLPDPCPAPSGAEWGQSPDGTLSVFYSLDPDNTLHVTTKSGIDEGTVDGIPGIREVCVYFPSTTPTDIENEWNLWPPDAGAIKNSGVSEFKGPEGGGENNNIPLDTNLNPVGKLFFSSTPDIGEAQVLLHLNDPIRCASDPDKSCFIVPYKNTEPFPELSTIILTSAGLLGIVLISRKYRVK